MSSTGYRSASVIIALTDGELHEDLLYYAEREVGEVKNTSTNYYHIFVLMHIASVVKIVSRCFT